jgi:hypothetical protein
VARESEVPGSRLSVLLRRIELKPVQSLRPMRVPSWAVSWPLVGAAGRASWVTRQ